MQGFEEQNPEQLSAQASSLSSVPMSMDFEHEGLLPNGLLEPVELPDFPTRRRFDGPSSLARSGSPKVWQRLHRPSWSIKNNPAAEGCGEEDQEEENQDDGQAEHLHIRESADGGSQYGGSNEGHQHHSQGSRNGNRADPSHQGDKGDELSFHDDTEQEGEAEIPYGDVDSGTRAASSRGSSHLEGEGSQHAHADKGGPQGRWSRASSTASHHELAHGSLPKKAQHVSAALHSEPLVHYSQKLPYNLKRQVSLAAKVECALLR